MEQLTAQADERGFDAILLGLTGGDIDWPFGTNVIPCGTNLHAWNYPEDGECLTPQETLAETLYYRGRRQLDFEERQQTGYELQEVLSELQGFVQLARPPITRPGTTAWQATIPRRSLPRCLIAPCLDLETPPLPSSAK